MTGAQRLVWLDHLDSGMTGWDTNGHPDAFMNADVATVARTIADLAGHEVIRPQDIAEAIHLRNLDGRYWR